MNKADMEVQAKAMAMVLKPIIKGVEGEAADQLDLIQDLQDRVAKLEALVSKLTDA